MGEAEGGGGGEAVGAGQDGGGDAAQGQAGVLPAHQSKVAASASKPTASSPTLSSSTRTCRVVCGGDSPTHIEWFKCVHRWIVQAAAGVAASTHLPSSAPGKPATCAAQLPLAGGSSARRRAAVQPLLPSAARAPAREGRVAATRQRSDPSMPAAAAPGLCTERPVLTAEACSARQVAGWQRA